MSQFRTITPIAQANFDIQYSDKIFLIGSCFSANIAEKLQTRQFKVLTNPYGIIFNPISVFKALSEIIDGKVYNESHLVFHNELEHSLMHHSSFSNTDPKEVVKKINGQIGEAHDFLKQSKVLYLTLGTAWVYTYDGEIVANCHKIPNHQFEKSLLSNQEIIQSFQALLNKLKAFNPGLHIVFTLSPVRHLKDGFEENSVSKAILRNTIHQLLTEYDRLTYFPAYEIMMDDLRDYRFYTNDMLHPNEQAVNYIWEKFCATYILDDTHHIMDRIEKLELAKSHVPRFPDSKAHQKHLDFIQKEEEALQEYYSE